MRRLPIALAASAVLVALLGIALGLRCGEVRIADQTCAIGQTCSGLAQECRRVMPPLLPPLLLAALVGLFAAWRPRPLLLLALGVVAAGPSTLAGLSLGLVGLAIAWPLAAGGALLVTDRRVALAGVAAAVAPLPLLFAVATLHMPAPWAFAVTLGPAAAWLIAVGLYATFKRRAAPPR